jgi:hypothetical protein
MLDRWLESPMAAVGFIFFVLVLAMIYLVNRERAQVQRMRGPKRFIPKWRDRGGGRKKRRRRRTGGFQPLWSEREKTTESDGGESAENAPGDEDPSSAG